MPNDFEYDAWTHDELITDQRAAWVCEYYPGGIYDPQVYN